jgi:regulatory protein
MATVTALRAHGARIAVELDGRPWRELSVAAVVEARLAVGDPLAREQVRALAQVVRRERATAVAVRALARRDRSRAELDARLARAGVRDAERRETLDRATRTGLVDDVRFASSRSRLLAERGAGDELVLADLGRHGVDDLVAREAVSELVPEADRAARIVEARGRSARTLRYLAARGFAEGSLEDLIAELGDRALR